MTDTGQTTDWRLLREFASVDLEKSFILAWETQSGSLLIDTDLHLLPEHPFFEKPRPAEKVCIRAAVIEFPLCDKIQAEGEVDNVEIGEVAAMLGLGAIRGLRRLADGRYEISGAFGLVLIDADRPLLRLRSP